MPTSGDRSLQPIADDSHGVPTDFCHWIAPVAAFRLYTVSFSVATITLLSGGVVAVPGVSTTSGWAYTCPSTCVANNWPNLPPLTVAGDRPGSLGSHPSRSRFCETVVTSCGRCPAEADWSAAANWTVAMVLVSASATVARQIATRMRTPLGDGEMSSRLAYLATF